MPPLEGRILPETIFNWQMFGLYSQAITNLELIDETQLFYHKSRLPKEIAVGKISWAIDRLIRMWTEVMRSRDSQQIQEKLHLTPVIAEETQAFPADSLLVPAVTFPPAGTLDLVTISHSYTEGAVISFESIFQSKNLVPTLDRLLDKEETDLIDVLYGPGQLKISDWIDADRFRRLVGESTAKTVRDFGAFLDQHRMKKPHQIKLFASGLQHIDTKLYEHYDEVMHRAAEESGREIGIPVVTDFSHLEQETGWIYGGIKIPEYGEPTPFTKLVTSEFDSGDDVDIGV